MTSEALVTDEFLDATGLNCPLPILKTKLRLKTMEPGETIKVLATDPGSKIDFEAYCVRFGHELLRSVEEDGVFEFVIRCTAQERKWPKS